MKKLLGILVLGLLLCSNAYAASKFTYLSCPIIVEENYSKGKHKELYKKGSYIGHAFIKFKSLKGKWGNSSSKEWLTVTTYYQGRSIAEGQDPDIWMSYPPTKFFNKEKFWQLSNFYFLDSGEDDDMRFMWFLGKDYDLSGNQNIFFYSESVEHKKLGIKYIATSNRYRNAKKVFDNNKFCEVSDKQEFNELIKKGIKKNTETKSNNDLTTKSNDDLTQQLMNLNELYKSGALTKEEFEKAKKKLLD